MNVYFFNFASLLYLLGTVAYLIYTILLKESLSRLAATLVSVGFASHTLALFTRYLEAGYTPVTNLYESLSFFAWMIVGILLIVNLKYKVKVLGSLLTPIALILMVFASALPKEILPLAPVLRSFWHPLHVIFAFLGNAIFALASAAESCISFRETNSNRKGWSHHQKAPPLKTLDDLNYQSLKFGFPS